MLFGAGKQLGKKPTKSCTCPICQEIIVYPSGKVLVKTQSTAKETVMPGLTESVLAYPKPRSSSWSTQVSHLYVLTAKLWSKVETK